MYIRSTILSLLAGLAFMLSTAAQARDNQEDDFFILPESTLEAAERRLSTETDPYRKYQILFRWIRIKEEVEKGLSTGSEDFIQSKRDIIRQLEESLLEFIHFPELDHERIFRELAFRHAELREFQKSIDYFLRIRSRTPDDELALGDAYFNIDEVDKSLASYALAKKEPRLLAAASYKSAWAYMRKNQFRDALKMFDLCITDQSQENNRLKAEAFRDRIRPFLETFEKQDFDQNDNQQLKELAKKVHPQDLAAREQLYREALQLIVQGFNSKSQVEQAQNAFFFLSESLDDNTKVLILSAPTWIQVYRARLDHEQVLKILNSLPAQALRIEEAGALRMEMYNTAVFYESFKEEEREREEAWKLLRATYRKYFQLFPLDPNADALRVNYSQILLDDGDARECLQIMKNRSDSEKELKELSSSLEGKCELKFLDQLYSETHTEFFYRTLNSAILERKIYERPDLGVEPRAAFESMGRMLIGSLSKNDSNEILRDGLRRLLRDYPYSKEDPLYIDLQTVSAELRFKDLLESNRSQDEKALGFYEIYKEARPGTSVAEKALTNSVLMGRDEPTLSRCQRFKQVYPQKFRIEDPVFDKCIQLSEHFLNLESEYEFWVFNESRLQASQLLRLGLLEMALDNKKGRSRIESLSIPEAQKALELWDGAEPKAFPLDGRWQSLESEAHQFINRLQPIQLAQIQTRVPAMIESFEKAEASIVEYFNSEPHPYWAAKSLELRARIASLFAEWMESLPMPADLNEEELILYQERVSEIVTPWIERAQQAKTNCGELAYLMSVEFKQEEDSFCPEATKSAEFQRKMREWRTSLPRNQRISQLVRIILSRAASVEELNRAKYYSLRVLGLASNERERASAFLLLARKTNNSVYWKAALELDGSLSEPIQWKRERVKGNPFYERLYGAKLRHIRAQGQR